MTCERCGAPFSPWYPEQKFCSKTCRRGAAQARKREAEREAGIRIPDRRRVPCPTPGKLAFESKDAAIVKALQTATTFPEPVRAYACECGSWHLTVKRAQEPAY